MLGAKFFAVLLLLGVLRVDAQTAVCGSAATGALANAATYVCTCPTGTGILGSAISGGAITVGNTGSPTYSTSTASSVTTVSVTTVTVLSVALNNAVTAAGLAGLCTDLLAGYAFPTAGAVTLISSLVVCPANNFCPGYANLFTGSAVLSSATALSYTAAAVITYTNNAYSVTTIPPTAGDDTPIPCPTNTGTATVTGKSTLAHCLVTNGYYVSTAYAATTAQPVISQCTVGNTCPTATTAATTPATSPVACTGGSNSGAGSFICPLGTYGTLGSSITASLAALTGEIICGTGYQRDGTASNCIASVAYYGASVNTGTGTPLTTAAATACPTGLTTDSTSASGVGLTALAGCTDLAAGYAFSPSVSATSSLSSLVVACAKTNYGCAGVAGAFKATGQSVGGLTFVGSTLLTSTSGFAAGTIATAATGANVLASCPSGITTASATNAGANLAACTDLAVGWALNPGLTTSTNITALLSQCTAGNYGCAGMTGFIGATASGTTGITFNTAACTISSATALASCTITTAAANSGANIKGTCPAFATNTFTATSSPTWAATAAAAVSDCTDLAPGYAMTPNVASTNQDPSVLLDPCTAGTYSPICAGSRNLFTANPVIAVTNITYYPGLLAYATSDLILLLPAITGSVFTAFGTDTLTNAPNSPLLLHTCPAGSTNAGGATMLSISSCIVMPGYYIDPSALNTPAACPANEYCLGGGAVGTAGGDTVCPHGSVGPVAASNLNSNINDCALSAGYYIATSAVNVPVPCPSGYICAGGSAVGTAGGSVACPTGSTNAACLTPAGPANTNTTVNSAPVTVSSPVTVAAPAVTVTPAPITVAAPAVTVTPAAITVTPAPITVNIPAPVVSAASTRSSALVLVLAALAAF